VRETQKIAWLLLGSLDEFKRSIFSSGVKQAGNKPPKDTIVRHVLAAPEKVNRLNILLLSVAAKHSLENSSGIPLSNKVPSGKVLLKGEVKEVITPVVTVYCRVRSSEK
jgi:hypothetical protein